MQNRRSVARAMCSRRGFLKAIGLGTTMYVLGRAARTEAATDIKPNILWLSCEDISPHIGCFGDADAITPNIDQLAAEGVRYTNAFTTAGVCAPCRSGIITGMYQTTIGTQHMRCSAKLPAMIKAFSTYLRRAGYYCTNKSKTDYQTADLRDAWNESSGKAHWQNRGKQQPFFAVFNFTGCHESGIVKIQKRHCAIEAFAATGSEKTQAAPLLSRHADSAGRLET